MNLIQEAIDAAKLDNAAHEYEAKILAKMSPKGALNLPTLLEQRRWQYGIVDACFSVQPAYDRVLVYQVDPAFVDGASYVDSKIVLAQTTKKRVREEAPRGILISAGAIALDRIRSHGMDLGHVIHFVRLAPWRLPVDMIEGEPVYLISLRDGDLVGSEDLAKSMKTGLLRFENVQGEHRIVNAEGVGVSPRSPFTPDDY